MEEEGVSSCSQHNKVLRKKKTPNCCFDNIHPKKHKLSKATGQRSKEVK
jgi:hypothetical protein